MTRFTHGTSGNPNGRPKGSVSVTSAIKRKLLEINPETKKQYLDDMVDVLIQKALKDKDFKAIREMWNHVDGTPRQTIEQIGEAKSLDSDKILERVNNIFTT